MSSIFARFTVAAVVLLGSASAWADARIVSGRTPAVVEDESGRGPSALRLTLGAGMSAAGDLFAFETGVPRVYDAPAGGSFTARRFTATLDEDVLVDLGLMLRVLPTTWLRLGGRYADMDITALANDTQIVTPAPWDRATFTQLNLMLEQCLAVGTWAPFVVAGVSYVDLDGLSDGLDQTGVAPVFGAGLRYRPKPQLGAWVEILDTVRQIDSEALVGDVLPQTGELTEWGPQHLVGLAVGLELGF
jgi:hypothetical protein